jgi:hypothetical protein
MQQTAASWVWVLACFAPLLAARADDTATSRPTSRPTKPGPRIDFDSGAALEADWRTSGDIVIATLDTQPSGTIAGVGGKAMLVHASPQSRLEYKQFDRRVQYGQLQELVVRIDAVSATPDAPVAIDVRFIADGRAAWRSTGLRMTQAGWQEIRVPTRHCASTGVGYCEWEDVARIGFFFRSAGTVAIDEIELVLGPNRKAALLPPAELAGIAFGENRPFLRWDQGPFVVLSDQDQLSPLLKSALEELVARATADWPRQRPPRQRVPLLIFADESAYRAFWPRIGAWYGVELEEPTTDGFTAFGIASAFCLPDATEVRPVWVHEAAHGLLAPLLKLNGTGSWLHEGLATRYQLAHTGQDLGPLVRPGLHSEAARLVTTELVNGGTIDPSHYWQAAMTVSFFLDQPEWRGKFNQAIDGMRRLGTLDLRPFSKSALGLAPRALERPLLEWAEQQFGE